MSRSKSLILLLALTACGDYGGRSWGSPSTGGFGEIATDEAPPLEDTAAPEPPECDAETPVVLYVSPDDSNSMSSPVQAREAVLSGWSSLGNVAIRTWEFLNYYQWDYASAKPGELALDVQLVEGEAEGEFWMQVGITSEAVSSRAPMNLTFVVDQSCSMTGHPLNMAQEAMLAMSGELMDGDIVSLVTWNTENNVLLNGRAVTGPHDAVLDQAILDVRAEGSTDLAKGLKEGYRLAEQNLAPSRINRIVLLSDGGANTGQTDEEIIASHAGGQDEDGIYMVGVGVGTADTYNDVLMDRVTDVGKGASVFVPTKAEAQLMFGDRFHETLAVAARNVQIQYDLPPGFEVVRFSGEEISENAEEVEPQHVSPGDSMVLHQQLASCDAVSDEDTITVTVRYEDAITFEDREVSQTFTIGSLLAGENTQLLKGAAVFAYAEALKPDGTATPSIARRALEAAESANPGDADLAEIRSVLDAL